MPSPNGSWTIKLKHILKSHFSFPHPLLHWRLLRSVKGKNHIFKIDPSAKLRNVKFKFKGQHHQLHVASSCLLNNVTLRVSGNNNHITLCENVRFSRGGMLWIQGDNNHIFIDQDSSFEDAHLAVTGSNKSIEIGKDCMFAYDIDVRTGDSHTISDMDGQKLNFEKSVKIGDHVWVGAHSTILKGVEIGSNCVIATRTVVTKSQATSHIIMAGCPATIIKKDITWSR